MDAKGLGHGYESWKNKIKRKQKKREHTDEDNVRELPFLGSAIDKQREPMHCDERMKK